MMFNSLVVVYLAYTFVSCKSLPHLQRLTNHWNNNSYIYYENIGDGIKAVMCVTDSSNESAVWRDVRGIPVQEGRDGTSCLYVTRGDGEISLNRRDSDCSPESSGLWRCDVPDSSGLIQSLYIYISNNRSYDGECIFLMTHLLHEMTHFIGQLQNVSFHFNLHTDPRAEVPEFTVSCRTYGGPVTIVNWAVNREPFHEGTSQVVLDTSHSVYDNRLRVTGKITGHYLCLITNNVGAFLEHNEVVNGKSTHIK